MPRFTRYILIVCLLILAAAMPFASSSRPASAGKTDGGGGFGRPTATPTIAPPSATATVTPLPTSTAVVGTPTPSPTPGGTCPGVQIDGAFGSGLIAALQQYRLRVLAYWPDPCIVQHLYAVNYTDPASGSIAWHTGGNGYVDVQGQSGDTIASGASHELAEMLADPFPYRFVSGTYTGPCNFGCPGNTYSGPVQWPVEIADPMQGGSNIVIGGYFFWDFALPGYFVAGSAGPWDYSGNTSGPLHPCWAVQEFVQQSGAWAYFYGQC